MATPHDSLVKRVFTKREDAIGELRSALPADIQAALALGRLEIEEGSFVDPEFVHRHVDLLYSVPLAEGEGFVFVYVLFEHQSTDDPLMVFRMLGYMVRVWEHYLREHEGVRELPLIVPLVLHHDEDRWQSAVSFHQLFPAELVGLPVWSSLIPSFRFLLDDISRASDAELQGRQLSVLARLALWALRDARFDRLEQTLAAWADLFVELLRSPGGEQAVHTIFWYIYMVRGTATANALAEKIPDPILREAAMTIAEQLRQEGRAEGRRGLVLKLLKLKFGPLDAATQARVAAADDATLDRYTERVLSAATLAAVLED